jgi:hypothetical protein
MADLLPINELPQYLPETSNMTEYDQKKFLARANGYCIAKIGGIPTYTVELPAEPVKTAVALAFEVFAEGQDAQTNSVNGNITEAAPNGFYVRKAENPLDVVDVMLMPYAAAFKAGNSAASDNGIMFL